MSPEPLTVIGFDYGSKRIGVAVGQSITASATPLTTLHSQHGKPDWDSIDAILSQWKPDILVLGLPLHADGSDSSSTEAVKQFGNQLQARYNLPLDMIDERLSSHEAEQLVHATTSWQLTGRTPKKTKQSPRKTELDHYAAKIILDSWFQQYANR